MFTPCFEPEKCQGFAKVMPRFCKQKINFLPIYKLNNSLFKKMPESEFVPAKRQRVRVRSYNKERVTPCHARPVNMLGEVVVVDKCFDHAEYKNQKKIKPWVAEWCGTQFVTYGDTEDEALTLMRDKILRVRAIEGLRRAISNRKMAAV